VNILTTLFGVVAATAISPAQTVGIDGVQSLDNSRHHVIQSEAVGRQFDVIVGLPDNYAAGSETYYPTIYLLDGGELYPLLRGYHRYLRFGEEAPDAIFVAISYGTSDWENGNERSHDYTVPSDEREDWGGAEAFQNFLSGELIPFIESTYHSRADRRVLFGQSIGGQFVLYTAQTKPTLFWGHIASNPALHRNLPFFLQQHAEMPPEDGRSYLYVGSGSNDEPQYREPTLQWMNYWSGSKERPWHLRAETLDGHSHFSAPPASFRRGILWLFSELEN